MIYRSVDLFLTLLFTSLSLPAETIEMNAVERLGPALYMDFDQQASGFPFETRDQKALVQLQQNGALSPKLVAGAKGEAWDFSETKASLAFRSCTVQALGNLAIDRGFSISVWLRHDSPRNSRLGGAGYGRQWELEVGAHGKLAITVAGKKLLLPKTRGSNDGKWHHLAASLDFEQSEENLVVYYDGLPIGTYTHRPALDFMIERADQGLFLGARATGGNRNHFVGAIDDFALFDRPLSDEEAALLHDHDGTKQQIQVPEIDLGRSIALPVDGGVIKIVARVENFDPKLSSLLWTACPNSKDVEIESPSSLETVVRFPSKGDYTNRHLRFSITTPEITVSRTLSVSRFENTTPETRTFRPAPAAGVHPRLYFTAEDLPALRENYRRSIHAPRAKRNILGRLKGKQKSNELYQKLGAGDSSMDISGQVSRSLTSVLASAAAVALMEENEELLDELAAVASSWAIAFRRSYRPNYRNYLCHDADENAALAYDLLYDRLTNDGRKAMRGLLARMSRHRITYGSCMTPDAVMGNWELFHEMPVLCALAIEGEPGYDPRVFELNVLKLRSFLTRFGIHRNGFAHEGDGYLNFGFERASLSMLATAMRDENLFHTTRFYANTQAKFREIQPWKGGTMLSHHDGESWGNGFFTGNIFWVTPHVFPNDRIANYNTEAYVRAAGEDRKMHIACLLFSQPPFADNETALQASGDLSLSIHEPARGLVNARSDWSENALRLDFECRMDTYDTGHLHADRNMFTLAALGRQWITDHGFHETNNDAHATVLIDGFGQPGSAANRWKSMPAIFIGFQDNATTTTATGDAKIAYSYHHSPKLGNKPDDGVDDPDLPDDIEAVLDAPAAGELKWSDIISPGASPEMLPRQVRDRDIRPLHRYNPVEEAFRSCALIRGQRPYVLVADNIRKDDKQRLYDWIAPLSCDTVKNPGRVVIESANETQAILRFEKDTDKGSPRLLVRVLAAEGDAAGPIAIESRRVGNYGLGRGEGGRYFNLLSIKRRSADPRFRILLFPFRKGDPLPKTEWNKDLLFLRDGEHTDEIRFREGERGECVIIHSRSGKRDNRTEPTPNFKHQH